MNAFLREHKYLIFWPALCLIISFAAHGQKFAEIGFLKAATHSLLSSFIIASLLYALKRTRIISCVVLLIILSDILVRYSYDSSLVISVWMSLFNAPISETFYFVSEHFLIILLLLFLLWEMTFSVKPSVLTHIDKRIKTAVYSIGLLYLIVPTLISAPILFENDDYKERQMEALAQGQSVFSSAVDVVLLDMGWRLPVLESLVGLKQSIEFMITGSAAEGDGWTNVRQESSASDLLVLVIGESTRADHLSLYGYPKNTTPKLDDLKDQGVLTDYNRAYSGGTTTWNSLPVGMLNSQNSSNISQSILRLAQKAGYITHWISNQDKFDSWGISLSRIADQADDQLFFNRPEGRPYDEILLEPFQQILAGMKPGQKHLVILHLYGSHSRFSKRYPPEYDQFKAGDYLGAHTEIRAAYDNTILYQDSLLTKFIELTKDKDGQLLFFADHGLTGADSMNPLEHDVSKDPEIDSLNVPLLASGKNRDFLPVDQLLNLYYLECVFAAWAKITAVELEAADYCKTALSQENVIYLDASLSLRKAKPVSLVKLP